MNNYENKNAYSNKFSKQDIKDFSTFLANLSPLEFTTYGCIIGIIITSLLNSNEQNSIGNFFELIGQVILTAQAQSTYNNSFPTREEFNNFKNETDNNINNIINIINKFKL